MTYEFLHAVRVQMNAVAGSESVWVLQILTKKHRRYPVDKNTLCRRNVQLFNITGLFVKLPLCFGIDILVGTQLFGFLIADRAADVFS
jgi:hypothetical protein